MITEGANLRKLNIQIERIPKVDLHVHLEGAIRPETIWELARSTGIVLPSESFEEFIPHIQHMPEEMRSLKHFLKKFDTTRLILTNSDTLARITFELLQDCHRSNVRYAEIRFNPSRMFMQGMTEECIRDGLLQGVLQAKQSLGIRSSLICGIARELGTEMAERVTRFALSGVDSYLVGLDLFGDEAFPSDCYNEYFARAKAGGLHITVHAGEAGGAENIKKAIIDLGAERIGHGVRIIEDPSVMELAKKHGIYFEMCPTSNYQTGAVDDLSLHPLPYLYRQGLNVGIHTDDPRISNTTLNEEYRIGYEKLQFSLEELVDMVLTTTEHIFLDSYREILKEEIKNCICVKKH